jgi:aspartate aminotransferase
MKSVARRLYSVPPAHGAIVVGMILADAALKQSWSTELEGMCKRINSMRKLFTDKMAAKGSKQDFSFVSSQYGMFSMLGLSVDQVQRLKKDYSVYMVNSSRVNIAGISEDNIDYLTDSVLAVL